MSNSVYRLELKTHIIPRAELRVSDDVVYRYHSSVKNHHVFLLFVKKILNNRVFWGGYKYNSTIKADLELLDKIEKTYNFLLTKYG